MSELPKGWSETTLDKVAEWGSGGTPKSDVKEYYNGTIPWAIIGDLNDGVIYKTKSAITNLGLRQSSAQVARKGSVLIAMYGSIGKLGIAGIDLAMNQAIAYTKKISDEIENKYLFYFLMHNRQNLFDLGKGGAQRNISQTVLKKVLIQLAPIKEQKQIVAKLDKLLAKVEESKARLEKIPGILKRFRQSVLNAATSGLLTKDYRKVINKNGNAQDLIREIYKKRNSSSEKQPDNLIIRTGYDIPEGWVQTNISNICVCLDSRRRPVNKIERSKRKGNIPYYGANGQVDTIDGYLFDEDLVCVVEDETFIGREIPFSYIIKGKSWVNNHAHVLKPDGGISVDYLNILLSYYNFTPLTSGTTGRRKLNQGALMSAIVTLAPINEQVEIVKRVKALLRKADEIEERYKKAKCHIDKITQSILAKAFRGELVPQDD